MRYSIISTEKGKELGIDPKCHRLSKDGGRMVVNECELLKLSNNPEDAASMLDGKLLSEWECIQQIKSMI